MGEEVAFAMTSPHPLPRGGPEGGRQLHVTDGRGEDGELFVVQVTFVCLFESEALTHALKKDEVGRPSAAPDGPNRRDVGEGGTPNGLETGVPDGGPSRWGGCLRRTLPK